VTLRRDSAIVRILDSTGKEIEGSYILGLRGQVVRVLAGGLSNDTLFPCVGPYVVESPPSQLWAGAPGHLTKVVEVPPGEEPPSVIVELDKGTGSVVLHGEVSGPKEATVVVSIEDVELRKVEASPEFKIHGLPTCKVRVSISSAGWVDRTLLIDVPRAGPVMPVLDRGGRLEVSRSGPSANVTGASIQTLSGWESRVFQSDTVVFDSVRPGRMLIVPFVVRPEMNMAEVHADEIVVVPGANRHRLLPPKAVLVRIVSAVLTDGRIACVGGLAHGLRTRPVEFSFSGGEARVRLYPGVYVLHSGGNNTRFRVYPGTPVTVEIDPR